MSTLTKQITPNYEKADLLRRMVSRIWEDHNLCGFSNEQVNSVLDKAEEVLTPEPACLRVPASIIVFGDVHGQLADLLRFLTLVGGPEKRRLLFLGDYVDRCKKSFEVIMLLLCYKIQYPERVFLLRGNHECSKMNRIYGFHAEMRRKRSVPMWKKFNDVFNELPLCAVIASKILCMHGGISPLIKEWRDLEELKKPKSPRSCDEGAAVDILWADPTQDKCCPNFKYNTNRRTSFFFGDGSVNRICENLGLLFIVRAHECIPEGHRWAFNKKLVTIFSAPNYCGQDGNSGSVMKVMKNLDIRFVTLKPQLNREAMNQLQQKQLERQTLAGMANSPDPGRPIPLKEASAPSGPVPSAPPGSPIKHEDSASKTESGTESDQKTGHATNETSRSELLSSETKSSASEENVGLSASIRALLPSGPEPEGDKLINTEHLKSPGKQPMPNSRRGRQRVTDSAVPVDTDKSGTVDKTLEPNREADREQTKDGSMPIPDTTKK